MGSASDAIAGARERLTVARFGQEDMLRPERRRAGLMNAIIFGRMATFQLQNMSSTEPDFAAWYDLERAEMKKNPVLRRCHDLRTEFEKMAVTSVNTGMTASFTPEIEQEFFSNPPPGAQAIFIGDRNGRSGWDVQTADGGIEHYFVDVPESVCRHYDTIELADGSFVETTGLVDEYLNYMDDLVERAAKKFLKS